MALFNEIQAGRFNRFVQKYLQMKGGPTVPTVSTDMFPMLMMGNALEPDNATLLGVDYFGAFAAAIGAAANLPIFELRNPKTSGVIAVVKRATSYNTAAADQHQITLNKGALNDQLTIVSAAFLAPFDTRGPRNTPSCIPSINNNQALTAIGGTQRTPQSISSLTNVTVELIPPGHPGIPVAPGDSFNVQGVTAAATLGICLWWTERALEDSEKLLT